MKPPTFPLFGASKIEPIIIGTQSLGGSATKEELSKRINSKVGTINNHVGMLVEMELIEHKGDEICLTPYGEKLAIFLKNKEYEQLPSFFDNVKKNSIVLLLAEDLLKTQPEGNDLLLGKEICERLGKIKGDKYYKKVGKSCVDIINFFKSCGELQSKLKRMNDDYVRPQRSYGWMLARLDLADDNGIIDKSFIKQNQRERDGYNTMKDLGLINEIAPSIYKLTNAGDLLKRGNKSEKKKAFREILLKNHELREVIRSLAKYENINNSKIGELLNEQYGLDWKTGTKVGFGKILMNWLKNAEFVFGGHGKYHVSNELKTMFVKPIKHYPPDVAKEMVFNSFKSVSHVEEMKEETYSEKRLFPHKHDFKHLLLHFKAQLLFITQDPENEKSWDKLDVIMQKLLEHKEVKQNMLLMGNMKNVEKRVNMFRDNQGGGAERDVLIDDLKMLYDVYLANDLKEDHGS